eukprot:3360155-Prymnesium_polylepis.1
MFTGVAPATGSAAIRTASEEEDEVGDMVKRRAHRMDMGGLHEPDSSQRSQLQACNPRRRRRAKSSYMIASLDMALTLAENGVRCVPPLAGFHLARGDDHYPFVAASSMQS